MELTGGGAEWREGALEVGRDGVLVRLGAVVVFGTAGVLRFAGTRVTAVAFGAAVRVGRVPSVSAAGARRAANLYGAVVGEAIGAVVGEAISAEDGAERPAAPKGTGAAVLLAVVPSGCSDAAALRAGSPERSVKASGEVISRPPTMATEPAVNPPAATATLPSALARARDLVRWADVRAAMGLQSGQRDPARCRSRRGRRPPPRCSPRQPPRRTGDVEPAGSGGVVRVRPTASAVGRRSPRW